MEIFYKKMKVLQSPNQGLSKIPIGPKILEIAQWYRYGELNPGLQDENLLS